MRAALKLIMILTGLLLLVAAAGLLLLAAPLEKLARTQVEQRLGKILQTEVSIAKLQVSPRDQALEIVDLAIHHPSGFDAGEMLHCSRLLLYPELSTLLSATPRIREIRADGVLLQLRHTTDAGINLHQTLKAAQAHDPSDESSPLQPSEEQTAPVRKQRRFRVERFTSSGARITASSSLLPIALPSLDLPPFSKDLPDEAISPARVTYLLLRTLLVETISLDTLPRALAERLAETLATP